MMNRFKSILVLGAFLALNSCQTENDYARERGVVSAFSELVNAGVKQLALSGTMSAEEMDAFYPLAVEEAAKYDVSVSRESDLIRTSLFPDDIAMGMDVLILYQGNTLNAYEKLKADKASLLAQDNYDKPAAQEIARRFGRLLSYSPRQINRLISENTDYRTLDDFDVKASNVFLYYKDLKKATAFYTKILGLELLTEYDNASVLKITDSSILILVDEAKGMHSAEEPKTVALALLTNQLPEWYAHIQEQKVPIKYTYKPKEGGPHDGFVAVDPEGYLLEFETFKQHKENESFMTYLDQNEDVETGVVYDGKTLSFNGSITWLYYQDMLAMQDFVENVYGFELVADQGWTKIYRATDTGFIGLVDERRGMHKFTKEKAVNVSFVLDDLEGWFDYAIKHKPFKLRSEELGVGPEGRYKAFIGLDLGGYFLEFDKFYEHPDNTKIIPLF